MSNPIAYFELAGPDTEALGRFYQAVLGWEPLPGPFPGYFALLAADAGLAGGLRKEEKPECVVYVKVDSLEATLAKVVAAGGTVLIPPTQVPGVVLFALFVDVAGNRVGLVR